MRRKLAKDFDTLYWIVTTRQIIENRAIRCIGVFDSEAATERTRPYADGRQMCARFVTGRTVKIERETVPSGVRHTTRLQWLQRDLLARV